MIHASKLIAQEPKNKEIFLHWTQSNERLMSSISKVKESLAYNDESSSISSEGNHTKSSCSIDVVSFRLNQEVASNSSISSSNYQETEDNDDDVPDIESLKINEGTINRYYIIYKCAMKSYFTFLI